MQTEKKFNSEIEKLKGEIALLLHSNEQTLGEIKTDIVLIEEQVSGFLEDIVRIEDDIAQMDITFESFSNALDDTLSSLETTDSNVAKLQVAVNTNIQDIQIKANKDLSNVAYPQLTPDGQVHTGGGYTTYMTTDGLTWYIIHPTGLKECGFIKNGIGTSAVVVVLPITFSSVDYNMAVQQVSYGNGHSTYVVTGRTTSQFNIACSKSNSAYITIYCCGR